MTRLNGVADIRRHFLTSDQRWFFISATNFNLLEMDAWVSGMACRSRRTTARAAS